MAQIAEIEFQCPNCTRWMPSAIQANDDQLFERIGLFGNVVGCPFCGQMVACGKSNVRFLRTDGNGGWVGDSIRTSHAPTPRTGKFRGETFRGETFLLDESEFDDCTFKGCILQFAGTGKLHLHGADLTQTIQPFRLVGPAEKTAQFFQSLYQGGMGPWVDSVFAQIKASAKTAAAPTNPN